MSYSSPTLRYSTPYYLYTLHALSLKCYYLILQGNQTEKMREVEKLKEIHGELAALFYFVYHKAGFDPNQPRVPAGNPDGGQWTDDGWVEVDYPPADGGVIKGNSKVTHIVTVPHRDGHHVNGANFFVGGLLDSTNWGKAVEESDSLHEDIYGDNYYATWTDSAAIVEVINRMPPGRQINLIGHSYGGDTVASIAEQLPAGRVHTLVTIDPVSRFFRPDFDTVKNHVLRWINVNAVGGTGAEIDNLIARGGKRWGTAPLNHAGIFIAAPYTHAEFDAMMNYAPKNGKSPQEMLNE